MSLSSNKVSKEKVSEIEERKQSNYIGFESISNIDLILMYLHNILGPISNFIFHQLNVKHQSPTLSILYYYISTIYDALDTFVYKKCMKTNRVAAFNLLLLNNEKFTGETLTSCSRLFGIALYQ